MSTVVTLRGQQVRLNDKDVIGVGGEARVFRYGVDEALKVYHPIPRGVPKVEREALQELAALRQQKIERFPQRIPWGLVAPTGPVFDAKGKQIVGFAMPRVGGVVELMKLGQRKWRQGRYTAADVLATFRGLHAIVSDLHRFGVIVGDLNDGNVLTTGKSAFLIDADSMQFDGLPCVVGHERTLDPRLYGEPLDERPCFTEESDWYAFAVLLFSCLTYVHPYGGVHSKLPTLLRRAEAGHSVLRDDVQRPRNAVPPEALGDALLTCFAAIFDGGERGAFPRDLLEVSFAACPRCGLEHALRRCPACTQAVPVTQLPAQTVRGRCREVVLRKTAGVFVASALQGKLRFLVEEEGGVLRENGALVWREERGPRLDFALAGNRTWVTRGGGSLEAFEAGRRVEKTSTGYTADGRSTFAASGHGLLRTEGDHLVHHESGRRLGRILDGQTLLRSAGRLTFGCYRAGALFFGFLVDSAGDSPLRDLPPLGVDGRVVEIEVAGDDRHLLVGLATEKQGRRTHALHLFDDKGKLLGRLAGAPDNHPALASVGGKAVAGGRVLSAGPTGLVLLTPEKAGTDPRLIETKTFPDARPFVSGEVDLHPGPGGTLYVVTPQAVTQLSLDASAPS